MLSIGILLFGLGAWRLQVYLAKKDNFYSVDQMLAHHGIGVPMDKHFGIMWSDPFFLTPLLAVLGWMDDRGWSWGWDGLVFVSAFVLSAVMHYQYLQDDTENAFMHDKRLTPAACVHFLFMWMTFTFLGHTYTRVPHENAVLLVVTSLVLFIHVVLGTHLIVKIKSPTWFPKKPPADTITLVVWAGAALLLSGLTLYNISFVR